ncbi:AAA family ATPase [Citrobacter braakii]|uniref:AAA family ATPase n=1 Tax=Citrobacter braakii TaxID=57706 RepID=UPI0018EC7B79
MKQHLTPGGKTVILINGIPASGKSTITRQLSEIFGLPLLTIDGIKEPFMARFAEIDRPFNRQLGCAAYEVIWSIVGQSPADVVWLIDAWFGFQPRETLQRLLQQAGIEKVIEVWNQIPPELAVSRYATRLKDRKPGHPGADYLPELALLAKRAEPMRLGPVFTVDQQQPPDIEAIIRWIAAEIT